jgi:2-oxoglutarate ferredoxin oxidoreductase subunit alpha
MDFKILIGGEAGQGVQTTGAILARAFTRMGFHVFADQDYESRIRGGHNFFRIRVKDSQAIAISETIDVLLALNKESLSLHSDELAQNGIAVSDSVRDPDLNNKYKAVFMPMSDISMKVTGSRMGANSVAIGALAGLTGLDMEIFNTLIREYFQQEDVAERNINAARAGQQYIIEQKESVPLNNYGENINTSRMLINGNEGIAMGALAAGCKFLSAYPMTPSTSIIEYMAANANEFNAVVVQPEDEIAAIHMAIGASYAGTRSMTVTSGGGFSLMVEAIGLAGMTETPVVIILGQRPGPAIGLPTRTEQGDLLFAINASHGEFPRVVLAPSTAEDAFWLTIKAFNLAEKYQLPVILMTDHYLASSYFTVEKFDPSAIFINRGQPLNEDEMGKLSEYKRHRITGSGISPRAFPMFSPALVVTDSDEHNEEGHLVEDAATRVRMVDKRMKKMQGLHNDIAQPLIYGPRSAKITIIGWGSTFGPLYDATTALRKQGLSINLLHFTEIWPFQTRAVSNILATSEKIFTAENNATGQFAALFAAKMDRKVNGTILKYDGRPFTSDYVVKALNKEAL